MIWSAANVSGTSWLRWPSAMRRPVFVTSAACWSTLCLHRERAKSDYVPAEAAFLARLTPYLAEGLRKVLLLDQAPLTTTQDGPGVLILAEDLSVVAMTSAKRLGRLFGWSQSPIATLHSSPTMWSLLKATLRCAGPHVPDDSTTF
jgi:hypothetical protein